MTPKKPVTLWRYVLPNVKHEGWGIFVLGSDGYFSACSDFGNYAHLWSHHGREDFREFLLEVDGDYLLGKLCGRRTEYMGDKTLAEIKRHILEARRRCGMSKEFARREWDLLDRHDVESHEDCFKDWYNDTRIDDAYEFIMRDYPYDAQAFAEKLMPRLKALLTEELNPESFR